MTKKYNLCYHVYRENANTKKIEKYNILNDNILDEIKENTNQMTDKSRFAAKVNSILMYHFWSRSEWEVIITDWPTRVGVEELTRLNSELEKYQKAYNREPYSLCVNLSVEEKIDAYDQVMLNWDIFIDYLWENLT